MSTYGNYIDRMEWTMLCHLLANKASLNTLYGITVQSRGYGKTMTTRALYRAITSKFARYYENISVRWCNGFEVLDNGKRRYCYVYLAKK